MNPGLETFIGVVAGVMIFFWALDRIQRRREDRPMDMAEVEKLARQGNEAHAIYAYRQATGASLEESKKAVDAMRGR